MKRDIKEIYTKPSIRLTALCTTVLCISADTQLEKMSSSSDGETVIGGEGKGSDWEFGL